MKRLSFIVAIPLMIISSLAICQTITPTPLGEASNPLPEIQLAPVDLVLENSGPATHQVFCGEWHSSRLDQTATCFTHKDQALKILQSLPPEFSTAREVSVFCDDQTRYWTFNCGARQVLYDAQLGKILMDNKNQNFNEQDEKGSTYISLTVSPQGRFVAKSTAYYEDSGKTQFYLLPSLKLAADFMPSSDYGLGPDDRFLTGWTGDPEDSQTKEVSYDLHHPLKAIYGKNTAEFIRSSQQGLGTYVPALGQYFGRINGGDTALYDLDSLNPVRRFPDFAGERFYASDSGRVLCSTSYAGVNLLNLKTGKEKAYTMGGENDEWLFETNFGASPGGRFPKAKRAAKEEKAKPVQSAPQVELKLIRRVNLRTLQVEELTGDAASNSTAMLTGSPHGQSNSWPHTVFSGPGGKGLWVGFLSRYTEKITFIYFGEDLEPRGAAFLNGKDLWLGGWTYVPSANGFFVRNREEKIFRTDFPRDPSHFSFFNPPGGTAAPEVAALAGPQDAFALPVSMDMAYQRTPDAIAADPKGFFYIAENSIELGSSRILKRDSQTGKTAPWIIRGKPKIYLTALALGKDGFLYAMDNQNRHILKINSGGNVEKEWSFPDVPIGKIPLGTGYLASLGQDKEGFLYGLDGSQGRVVVFDKDGKFTGQWDCNLRTNYQGGQNMAVGPRGEIYITQALQLSRYDRAGKLLWRIGGYGTLDNEFTEINGIAADEEGNVYVRDKGDWIVKAFDPEGKPLKKYPASSVVIAPGTRLAWNSLAVLGGKVYVPYDVSTVTYVPASR